MAQHHSQPQQPDDEDHADAHHVAIPMAQDVPGYEKLTTPSGETPAGNTHSHHSQQQEEQANNNAETSEDLMHGINSFWALVFPVCVTMIIASVVVVNYRSSAIEASMQTYLVYGDSDSSTSSAASSVGMSLVNALVIIGAIALLTFGMALLYYYNCMKFLGGYIMFASMAILSFVGGQLVDAVVNDQFGWAVDWPSFIFVMGNFGVVGVISIFYQKGTPKFVQNGYLVLVSVILAWEFSMWPMWTTITFCFMFAVYDLCAVLTPCGPLKVLIGLIQDKQAPLPGLLYEADVRDGVGNETRQQAAVPQESQRPVAVQVPSSEQHAPQQPRAPLPPIDANAPPQPRKKETRSSSGATSATSDVSNSSASNKRNKPRPTSSSSNSSSDGEAPASFQRPRNVAESDFTTYDCESMEELISLLEEFYRIFSPEDVWKAGQVADKFFPTQDRLWLLIFHKYKVCSCSMGMPCPIQARHDARARRAAEEDEDDKTIKLGLGDFIFYSVLVGRAAMFDFSTFVATFVCIVVGLGGTLFLLSVLHKALPALPISIFLAVFFYFWTRYLFIDFCDFLMTFPAAV